MNFANHSIHFLYMSIVARGRNEGNTHKNREYFFDKHLKHDLGELMFIMKIFKEESLPSKTDEYGFWISDENFINKWKNARDYDMKVEVLESFSHAAYDHYANSSSYTERINKMFQKYENEITTEGLL